MAGWTLTAPGLTNRAQPAPPHQPLMPANHLPPEVFPVAAEGPIRANLRPDGRYSDYYVHRKESRAWVWPVVPEWVYRGAANDA